VEAQGVCGPQMVSTRSRAGLWDREERWSAAAS